MQIPTDAELRALHERYAPTPAAFDLVHTHCRIVCELVEQLAAGAPHPLDVDLELVRAGALVHDLGVYRHIGPDGRIDPRGYVRHGLDGHELLTALGLPERLGRFCSRHTGMGLTRDDVVRQGLLLPARDYLAETAEEELVMYADKFHRKTAPPAFVTPDAYAADVVRFGADKVERFTGLRQAFGDPDLGPLARRYGHPIR